MRGLNIPILWCDEFAFLNMNKTMYMSARPALNKASEAAEAVGQPHGILITTTPNNLDVPEGKFCYDMIQKAAKFTFEWYDKKDDEIKEYLEKNSGNGYVFIMYHYYELGRDEKWLKAQIRALEGDMAKVKREILIEWTYASNMSIFTEEQLDNMSQYISKETYKEIMIDGYKIDVIEMSNNIMYKNWVLSVDIAGGLGKDYSAFSLIDPMSYKMVMKFKNNLISVTDFANLVIKFVKFYVPNAVIVPERNNAGPTFIEVIQKSDVAKNLYYTSTSDIDYTKKKIKRPKLKKSNSIDTETRTYGFNTDKEKRKVMTEDILFMIAEQRPDLVNNMDLFDEMRRLIREKSGKINHMNTEHDDLTMSYLIGLYILIYASNRNKFIKNISNQAITCEEDKIKPVNVKFKRFIELNNEEKMETLTRGNIDQELLEMQRLIDEKNKKPVENKLKNFKSIMSLNSIDGNNF